MRRWKSTLARRGQKKANDNGEKSYPSFHDFINNHCQLFRKEWRKCQNTLVSLTFWN